MNLTELFTFQDSQGNQINFDEGKLFLSLPSGVQKLVGNIEQTSSGHLIFYKEVNSKKHIFRKTNSVSIPYYIYKKLELDDSIWIRVDKNKTYKAMAKDFKMEGKMLNFTGFERQIALQLDKWTQIN